MSIKSDTRKPMWYIILLFFSIYQFLSISYIII